MSRTKAFSYIRFSTAEQSKGRSKERQLTAAKAYAVSRNLELDESLSFQDLGVSAFRGRNLEEGAALGAFLKAVKDGLVPKGSYLLVESLDRVSREAAYDAVDTIKAIVSEGVTVVDLADGGRVYSADILRKDPMAFLMMIVRFMRANEESQRKSERLTDAWAKKRKFANNQVPMTSMAPAWLKLNADKKGYTVIKDRALTIKRIFDESASGLGVYAITKRLNEKNTPHFGKSNGWRMPYVQIILKNRAVLGEFQPHKYVDGKRVPVDEEGNPLPKGTTKPIPYYYPQIVDEQTFNRVQHGIASRRNAGAGRKGKAYSSLFSGLLRCNLCEGSVYLENKGRERYLVCANSRSHDQCQTARWRYEHFEHSVLFFLSKQIDLKSVISVNKEEDRRYQLDASIEGLQGKKIALIEERDGTERLRKKVKGEEVIDYVAAQLDRIFKELKTTDAELINLTSERDTLIAETEAMAEADIKGLIENLQNIAEEERYKVRSDLATNLKKLVARIDVQFPPSPEMFKRLAESGEFDENEIEGSNDPSFHVRFKNGRTEICYTSRANAFDPEALGFRESMQKLEGAGVRYHRPRSGHWNVP